MLRNLVILEGRLTKKPELRTTPQGTPVTDVRIAVTGRKRPDEAEAKPTYITVDVFGNRAQTIATYLDKGDQIFIQGELREVSRTTQDGREFKELRVSMTEFEFGAKARANIGNSATATAPVAAPVQPNAVPAPAYDPAVNAAPSPMFNPNAAPVQPAPAPNYGPGTPGYVPQAPANDITMGDVFSPNAANNPQDGNLMGNYYDAGNNYQNY